MGSEKADQKSIGNKVSGILPIRALFLSPVAFRFPSYTKKTCSSSNTVNKCLTFRQYRNEFILSYNHSLCLGVHDEGNDEAYISYLAIMGNLVIKVTYRRDPELQRK